MKATQPETIGFCILHKDKLKKKILPSTNNWRGERRWTERWDLAASTCSCAWLYLCRPPASTRRPMNKRRRTSIEKVESNENNSHSCCGGR